MQVAPDVDVFPFVLLGNDVIGPCDELLRSDDALVSFLFPFSFEGPLPFTDDFESRVLASRNAIQTLVRAVSFDTSTQTKMSFPILSSFKNRAPYSFFSIRSTSQVHCVDSFLLWTFL